MVDFFYVSFVMSTNMVEPVILHIYSFKKVVIYVSFFLEIFIPYLLNMGNLVLLDQRIFSVYHMEGHTSAWIFYSYIFVDFSTHFIMLLIPMLNIKWNV